MKPNMIKLASVLQTLKSLPQEELEDDYRVEAIQNGATAMLLLEGAGYKHVGDDFSIFIDEDQYSVSEDYLEAYLGEASLSEIKSRNGRGDILTSDETTLIEYDNEDVDKIVFNLGDEVSDLYTSLVLDAADSIPELQERIADLMEENERLKRELKKERNRNAALTDRLNIISGRAGKKRKSSKRNTADNVRTKQEENKIKATETVLEIPENDIDSTDVTEENQQINIHEDPVVSPKTESVVMQPEIKAESEEKDQEPAESQESVGKPTQEEEPSKYGIFPYRNDIYEMNKSAFCFVYNQVLLTDDEMDIVDAAELLVIPLTTKVKYPDMLVWIARNHDTETRIIKGASKVELEFGEFDVILSGVMKGSEFKSYLRQANDDNPYHLDIKSQSNGTLGHLYLSSEDDESIHVHVCPVTFSNNDEGFADFVYCVECNGEYIQQGDNSEGDVCFIDKNGDELRVVATWRDNSLYGTVLKSVLYRK